MALQGQTYTTTVAASPSDCFAVITNFPAYPNWSSAVRSTTVRAAHPDGIAKQVEMELDIKVRRIRYTLEYCYDPPTRLEWHLVAGDIKGVEGAYVFEEISPGCTQVTCTQAVDVGFWIPGFLRSVFEQQALRDSVEEFKRAVEAQSKPT